MVECWHSIDEKGNCPWKRNMVNMLNVKRVEDYEIKVRAVFYHNFWFTRRITETDIIWKIIQNLTIFLKVRLDS